jgi:hypothetical protein
MGEAGTIELAQGRGDRRQQMMDDRILAHRLDRLGHRLGDAAARRAVEDDGEIAPPGRRPVDDAPILRLEQRLGAQAADCRQHVVTRRQIGIANQSEAVAGRPLAVGGDEAGSI